MKLRTEGLKRKGRKAETERAGVGFLERGHQAPIPTSYSGFGGAVSSPTLQWGWTGGAMANLKFGAT